MTRRQAPARWLVALAAAVPVTAAGCFTDPINQPPATPTVMVTTPFNHGDPASFTVSASDPDHDDLSVTWGEMSGSCPDDKDVSSQSWQAGAPMPPGQPFMVGPEMTGSPFCVCAFVTDTHHAASQRCIDVIPGNRPPEPIIVVEQPTAATLDGYPLNSRFRLSATGSLDADAGDQLTIGPWSVVKPDRSPAALIPCPVDGGDPSDACFTADQTGPYQVVVTVSDDHGGRAMTPMVLTVAPDRLPCLASSDPDWKQPTFSWAASTDRNFTITSVDDDLVDQNDQVPLTGSGQRIHFTWYEGPASGPLLIQGDDYPTFRRVANPLQAGETRRVRVEIRDDNVDEINRRLFNCGDADQCGNGTDCLFRATWTVKYNL